MMIRNYFRAALAITVTTSSMAMAALTTQNDASQTPENQTDPRMGPAFRMSSGLHLVLRDFSVEDETGEIIDFTAGENLALDTATDGSMIVSYLPFEVEAPAGTVDRIRISPEQIPADALTFLESGDENDLAERSFQDFPQEARLRRSQTDADSIQTNDTGSLFGGFFGGGSSTSGTRNGRTGRSKRIGRSGGRMILRDSKGRFQAKGCVAFVQSRVGWPGGPVGNGVGMVRALIRRLNWSGSDCSPAEGKVASWSGGHKGGAGHTAIYNSARGCWEYDSGCTGLQISGFRLRSCAVSSHMAAR
jgi:hypothetical protein